ncbi:hypothetical protein [Sphingomonas oryzagri]
MTQPQNANGFEFDEVVDLTPEQVAESCRLFSADGRGAAGHRRAWSGDPRQPAQQNRDRLLRALPGPCHQADPAITDDKHAFLCTWDDWTSGENGERGYGHYAVAETTFRSLRAYFELD